MLNNYLKELINSPDAGYEQMLARLEKLDDLQRDYHFLIRAYLSSKQFPNIYPALKKQKLGKKLFGTLFAVKDVFAVKGQMLTAGLSSAKTSPGANQNKEIQDQHSGLVDALINAGASLVGSSNLDPLALNYYGQNPIHGDVINPNYKAFIAGGSSSGSAAIVASEICNFAIGSDCAGSIRIPAACCGISGYKASNNFLPEEGHFKISKSLDASGILAHEPEDFLVLLEALDLVNSAKNLDVKLYVANLNDLSPAISTDYLLKYQNYITLLKSKYTISELELSLEFELCNTLRKKITALEFKAALSKFNLPFEYKNLPSEAKALLTLASNIDQQESDRLQTQFKEYQERITELLKNKFLILPNLTAKPPLIDKKIDQLNYFSSIANIVNLPAVCFPMEKNLAEPSFSLQIIGEKNSDSALLYFVDEIYKFIHK